VPLNVSVSLLLQYNQFVQRVKSVRTEEPDPRLGGIKTVRYAHAADLDEWVKEVCSIYLNADDKEREDIREMFQDRDTQSFLFAFTERASEQVKHSTSIEWLTLGLAALSIEDQRSDSRDTDLALWQLYRRAESVGINANPIFRRVAALSSDAVAAQMRYSFPDLRKAPLPDET
jgi:hypothetical protein